MMNYPNTVANLPAFSFWPDTLAAGEEMAAWAQSHPAGYAQPGVRDEGISLDILDSVLAWGQSGRSCIEAPTSRNDFVSRFATKVGANLHLS